MSHNETQQKQITKGYLRDQLIHVMSVLRNANDHSKMLPTDGAGRVTIINMELDQANRLLFQIMADLSM